MIGKNIQENESVKPNSRQMKKLRDTFPEYFNNKDEFELDRFKEFLNNEKVDISKESYQLEFLGKSYAKYLSSLETETYISPDSKHNNSDENKKSENLYIVGDNIDALKHLLNSYTGKIKCIYIDPPYNTGSDGFVYPDNFQFNANKIAINIGITEEEAQRILGLSGKSTHSAWLTFMYPRLVLARDLLSDDGVIFISIDDNEQSNLKLICDEIFGEQNFVGCLIWKTTPGSNTGNDLKTVTEYVLTYSKNKVLSMFRGISPNADSYKQKDEYFKNRGPYKENKLDRRMTGTHYSDALNYPIQMPDNTELWPGNKSKKQEHWNWRWSREKVKWGKENDFLIFKKKEDGWSVYFKQYLLVDNNNVPIVRSLPPQNLIKIDGLNVLEDLEGINSARGTKDAMEVLGDKYFDYPKPVNLIKYLISIIAENDIVLDFFSGSATTAEAVIRLNFEKNIKNKFIMVQLPQELSKESKSSASRAAFTAGFKTLDEIGRKRIEKVADEIKAKTEVNLDYGYKLYYLQKLKERTLVNLEKFEPEVRLASNDMISIFNSEHAKGKDSILATWINNDGYGLAKESKSYILNSYSADLIENSLYIIDEGLEDKDVITLIKRIENDEIDITRVVIYIYSINFSVLQELRTNLKVLRNNKNITLIERF